MSDLLCPPPPGPSNDALPFADQLDPVNAKLLPVLRHFLNAFLAPETYGWRHGYAAASGTWGQARGLAIADAMQAFLAAVLQNRPVPFIYADPLDLKERQTLLPDEVEFLALITCMRSDRTSQARIIIGRLTGGMVPAAVVRTGLSLASLLDPDQPVVRQTKRPAKLRVVS